MFIQVIEGHTSDPMALHRQSDAWHREIEPGAIGYLGSTGGVTSDGDAIFVIRFESVDAAMQNSKRPEQSSWWSETEKCFDGPITIHDTTDVQVMDHGDKDQAHFVQVMEGHVTDKERAHSMNDQADETLRTARPDLIGTVTAFHDGDAFTEVAYFTSQEDARKAEHEMPSEMPEEFADFQDVMKVERYLDIEEPWLASAH